MKMKVRRAKRRKIPSILNSVGVRDVYMLQKQKKLPCLPHVGHCPSNDIAKQHPHDCNSQSDIKQQRVTRAPVTEFGENRLQLAAMTPIRSATTLLPG